MVVTRRLSDNSVFYQSERCMMQTWKLGNGVLQTKVRGLQSEELVPFITGDGASQIERYGRVVYFVDARESRQMTTEFRERMTAWFAARKELGTVHMLLHSKLLEMALNLANLATGTATARAYAKLGAWEAAGQKAVPGFRARDLTVPEDLRPSPGS